MRKFVGFGCAFAGFGHKEFPTLLSLINSQQNAGGSDGKKQKERVSLSGNLSVCPREKAAAWLCCHIGNPVIAFGMFPILRLRPCSGGR
jgi:hypothetical protein